VTDPYTFKSLPYNPMKDFVLISRIAEVTFTGTGASGRAGQNLSELLAYAKANPEKLAIATDGRAALLGMIAAWLNKLGGTQIPTCRNTR
jgi:tripartite-type tricarboxylate transporter receptor subunit TctC